jgi:hypothetical protein
LHEVPSSFFDLLNDNAIDLDQTPLGDFEHDMDEGNGDKVDEIEEGLFDVLRLTQRKRTMNYTDVDDACLV